MLMVGACVSESYYQSDKSTSNEQSLQKLDEQTTPNKINSDDESLDVSFENETSPEELLEPESSFGSISIDQYTEIPNIPKLPNLKPGWLWDTDGPIILSSKPGTSFDEVLLLDSQAFVDIVVFNASLTPVDSSFNVDIFFDNQRVYEIKFKGPTPATGFRRSIDIMTGIIDSLNITTGEHVIKIIIDPDNLIKEFDELDNVFEKTFVWSNHQIQDQFSKTYSNDELKSILANVSELLLETSPIIDTNASVGLDEVLNIADAGIFLLTGSSILDERIRVQILSRKEYLNRVDTDFRDIFALDDGTNYQAIAREKDFQKNYSLGKKSRLNGMIDIVIDGSHPFDLVMSTLVHELGHALQDLISPQQTEDNKSANAVELMAIREAEAQQFERAFWLAIQEFTGENLLSFPYSKSRYEYINLNTYVDPTTGYYQHELGRIIQWLAVLSDINLKDLKNELMKNGQLSAQSGFRLFQYLTKIEPEEASTYVDNLLLGFDSYLNDIISFQQSRLLKTGPGVSSGYLGLEKVGLLMP